MSRRTSNRSIKKNVRKPTPTSAVTRAGSPTLSIASGRTSNSATATTTPPVSAMTVGSECARRSATQPPMNVPSTVNAAKGSAIQVTAANQISAASRRLGQTERASPPSSGITAPVR